jgi:lipopolysaccharide/colanic/teichoic acid biosynthesis glycosyltransferase
MPILSPSSRGSFRVRFSTFDILWAAASPLLALYFRDAYILNLKGAPLVFAYCGISFACSLIAFSVFRIGNGISRYFSVHDVFNIIKAALSSGLMTSLVLFTFTRLEGIPRTTPILQFLILVAGLVTARTVMMLRDHNEPESGENLEHALAEHIIIIGTNRLSSLYIKFLNAYAPKQRRIIAVLDYKQHLVGRAMCGVPVVASPQQLDHVVEEFEVHGLRTDRVIIAGDENYLNEKMLNHVRCICAQRDIEIDFLPDLVGLNERRATLRVVPTRPVSQMQEQTTPLGPYFQLKRVIDFVVALLAILAFAPLFLLTTLLILLDLGSPVLFWQQRIGQAHKRFFLYKFRTLRPPFDAHGNPVPESERRSFIGRCLRQSRLDELPQLFNVLVGDMSLIGPRPLLPHDQPANSTLRLTVRPGITGWAQINGGNLVTPEEKGALDVWYIRHASLWLDLRITILTLRFLFTGERRSQDALTEAYATQQHPSQPRPFAIGRLGLRDIVSTREQTPAPGRINNLAQSNRRAVRGPTKPPQ